MCKPAATHLAGWELSSKSMQTKRLTLSILEGWRLRSNVSRKDWRMPIPKFVKAQEAHSGSLLEFGPIMQRPL